MPGPRVVGLAVSTMLSPTLPAADPAASASAKLSPRAIHAVDELVTQPDTAAKGWYVGVRGRPCSAHFAICAAVAVRSVPAIRYATLKPAAVMAVSTACETAATPPTMMTFLTFKSLRLRTAGADSVLASVRTSGM